MKLYYTQVAPNPTKVRLYLAEKAAAGVEIALDRQEVNLREGEQRSQAHLARHPLGKVPVLELDDGSCLFESLPIIDYFEELHPEPSMWGRDPLERARAREIERVADFGVLIPVALVVHATRSPLGWPPNPGVEAFFRERLPSNLKVIDDRLSDGRPYLAGDRPTVADCTLAAALQFGRFGQVEIDPAFEHVARWDAAYRGRPEVAPMILL
jgi:glutathione S-transferase